jgi:DNA-binding NtrC family response regulator
MELGALITRPHCLIVDPDPAAAAMVRRTILSREPSADVTIVTQLARAQSLFSGHRWPTCVVTELLLPDAEGPAIIRRLRAHAPHCPVLAWVGRGSEALAVATLRAGALDYIAKHEGNDRLLAGVGELIGRSVLACSTADVPLAADGPTVAGPSASLLVARSLAMQRVIRLIERASHSAVPVLVSGETGCGKELVARAIHERGPRHREPFLAQNCAALSETLLESELFGHLRGAFTGAVRDRPGLFMDARGGTVFLDEIGDAPASVQTRLLRVLENGEVKPLGADRVGRMQARVVAATNRRLDTEVDAGRFRRDLHYRLNVLEIEVPPLRHRVADLPELAGRLLARCEAREERRTGGLAPDAIEALMAHPWPGNVRELEHELHRLVLTLPRESAIRRAHLAPALRDRRHPVDGAEPLAALLARVEASVLLARLATQPSKAAAARSLGITREGLYRRLRRARLTGS